MSEYAELVFDKIPKKEIGKFIDYLLQKSTINSVQYVDRFGIETVQDGISGNTLDVIESSEIYHILIKSPLLILDEIEIPEADIWLYFYASSPDGEIDCLVFFELLNFEDFMVSDIPKIMSYAHNLSEKFAINDYYCGLEPSWDKETRFFTKTELGPLR